MPGAHATHCNDEDTPVFDDHVPAGQFTHCDALVIPLADDHVPARQEVQDEAPWDDDQLPGKHATHCAADDEPRTDDHVPTLQSTHVLELLAPMTEEYDPAVHDTHEKAPAELHEPALHCWHCIALDVVAAMDWKYPAGHTGATTEHVPLL